MNMPKPTEHHEQLARLAGEWRGHEILHPSPWAPERREAVGAMSSRMDLDGMFLITDYVEERDGEVVFRGHGVYGWDAGAGKYTMYWFDSMGYPPNQTLGVLDGDTLTFENSGEHGKSRYVYEIGDGEYRFSILSSRDGAEWTPMMEGVYKRA